MTKQQIAGDYNQKIKQAENDTRTTKERLEEEIFVVLRDLSYKIGQQTIAWVRDKDFVWEGLTTKNIATIQKAKDEILKLKTNVSLGQTTCNSKPLTKEERKQAIKEALKIIKEAKTISGRTLEGENQVYVDARELYNPEIEKALKEQKKKIIKIIEDKFYGANDVKVRDIIKEIKKGNYEL